jgi:Cu+-exporting ATPase
LAESASAWETEGRTLSWLIEQSPEPRVLGLFAFGDTLKPGALQAVQQLSARHISSHLLTGDNRGSAKVVAEALGIDRCACRSAACRQSRHRRRAEEDRRGGDGR